jgi:Flp pilus assembly protein protease CpaA
MLPAILILFILYIALNDLRTHKITDKSNFALFLLLLFDANPLPLLHLLLAWLILIAISLATQLGGGDFKLLTVLLVTQGKVLLSASYGVGIAIAASLTVFIVLLIRGNLDDSVPMGPVILAPFAISYLAI